MAEKVSVPALVIVWRVVPLKLRDAAEPGAKFKVAPVATETFPLKSKPPVVIPKVIVPLVIVTLSILKRLVPVALITDAGASSSKFA